MADGLVETAAQSEAPRERRIYGVTPAYVTNVLDFSGEMRVQVRLPLFSGVEPWARVAAPMAGMNRGIFFLPQIGDEVLVAFNNGDIADPFIVGGLWSRLDRAPVVAPPLATTRRVIRTGTVAAPLVGHEVEFDDLTQTITITSSTQQKVTLSPVGIEVATTAGTAKVALDTLGNITIQAALSISLKAPKITIQGGVVEIKSAGVTNIKATGACNIQGRVVKIN